MGIQTNERVDVHGVLQRAAGTLRKEGYTGECKNLCAVGAAVSELIELLVMYQTTNAMETSRDRELFSDAEELLAHIGGAR